MEAYGHIKTISERPGRRNIIYNRSRRGCNSLPWTPQGSKHLAWRWHGCQLTWTCPLCPSVYRSVWTQPCPSAPGAVSALQLYSQTCNLKEPNYSPKFLQILFWSSGSVNLSISIVKYLWHFYQLPFFSGLMRTLELCCDLLTMYCHLEPYIYIYIYVCMYMHTHITVWSKSWY